MAGADISTLSVVSFRYFLAKLKKREGRAEYFADQIKMLLAAQIRALRGDLSQTEFGERIGKPQSVISRLERQVSGNVNLQTLIDIATKLDIALIVRFPHPAFTKTLSSEWRWKGSARQD